MTTTKTAEKDRNHEQSAMQTPPVVTPEAWEAARQEMLVKEKAVTRARDALAAERRRMPWTAVEKKYTFDGPKGKVGLLDLFEGRRQLIVYRAFFEPGVFGWPDHACRGCSLGADQVAHLAHLNARDTTLVYASRAPQTDIARQKARMGWEMPWYSITDGFDKDFGVDEWHGTNVFFRDGDRVFRTYFINNRGDEAMGGTWSYLDITALGRQRIASTRHGFFLDEHLLARCLPCFRRHDRRGLHGGWCAVLVFVRCLGRSHGAVSKWGVTQLATGQ